MVFKIMAAMAAMAACGGRSSSTGNSNDRCLPRKTPPTRETRYGFASGQWISSQYTFRNILERFLISVPGPANRPGWALDPSRNSASSSPQVQKIMTRTALLSAQSSDLMDPFQSTKKISLKTHVRFRNSGVTPPGVRPIIRNHRVLAVHTDTQAPPSVHLARAQARFQPITQRASLSQTMTMKRKHQRSRLRQQRSGSPFTEAFQNGNEINWTQHLQ
jgi:hypothetical protein